MSNNPERVSILLYSNSSDKTFTFFMEYLIDLLWKIHDSRTTCQILLEKKLNKMISHLVVQFVALIYFVEFKSLSGKWSQRKFCYDLYLFTSLMPLYPAQKTQA